MSVRILAAAAILAFLAALFVAMPRSSTSAELSHEMATVAIDFDALRAEAAAALRALEQSHERHIASADVTGF
ncbi:MAG TPA: hypothetical protein VJ800_10335 [Pseudolabrys sp.]|nr:hypothetical protein [Pseudolabrys sp.]